MFSHDSLACGKSEEGVRGKLARRSKDAPRIPAKMH
jgi:hypothetical protein